MWNRTLYGMTGYLQIMTGERSGGMRGCMSYKQFVWPNNPHTLTYASADGQQTVALLSGNSRVLPGAASPRIVRGEGAFYGREAQVQMNRLEQVFLEQGPGVLFLPNRRPMRAWFTELTVLEQTKKDTVAYQILFTEENGRRHESAEQERGGTIAREGESLFDVAARTGVAVEVLGTLNCLPGCFSLQAGDEVRLK